MNKLYRERSYSHCYSYNFFIHISTKGEVTPCIAFIDDADYSFGNINEKSFIDIWGNKSKTEDKIHQHGVVNCREICRSDEINRYLYRLKHTQSHDNFI
jgi:radical SAM protein with 4Fe4S-binding SPASM domain